MSRISRKATVGIITSGAVLGAAGVAAAAILLTTNITGQASVNEVATKNEVTVTASSVNGSKLDCSDLNVSNDFKTLTFNPKLTKPTGGGNSSNVPVPGGDCTITVKVKNTGDTTLKVDGSSQINQFPAGWTVSGFTGNALAPIAPGAEASLSAKLTATQAAVAGPISGKLVYSDSGA